MIGKLTNAEDYEEMGKAAENKGKLEAIAAEGLAEETDKFSEENGQVESIKNDKESMKARQESESEINTGEQVNINNDGDQLRSSVKPRKKKLDLNMSIDASATDDGNDGLFDFYRSIALADERLLKSMLDAGQPLMKLASLRASPLLLSVWTNNPKTLSTLLHAGADGKNIDKKSGFAPLHHAAMCEGASECIKLLIENGADVKIRTHRGGFTPLFLACVLGITDNAATLLALASRKSDSAERASFVDSSSSGSGHTCLVAAVKTGNCELVSLLVHCKASVFVNDPGSIPSSSYFRDDMLEALLGRSVRKARRLLPKESDSLHRSASDFIAPSTSSRLSPGPSAPRMGGGFVGMTVRPDGRTGFLSSIALARIPESARMRRVMAKGKQNMKLMEKHLVPPPVDVG
ncbi:hypothetical protein FOL47_005927 [Perkinsus chesapeaki]|uniref:Ankyrin Repeat n=1 Tax=Perkinsus chesapeaki TaxID=330153 RepID=A0A7J6LW37_PERCH|nr:hypothetical protein FOL47_005927 [Perkinsus chesapeaki]